MKKLLLLFLLVAGGVSTASADGTWYLKGDFNTWGDGNPFTNGSTTVSLDENETYEFKLFNGSTWYGNGGTMEWYNCSGWNFSSTGGNCTIHTVDEGDYTFTLSGSTLTVTYPNLETVYFYNNHSWPNVYVYLLGSSYWDSSTGSGSYARRNGVAMSKIGETNIWKLDYPTSYKSSYIAFLKSEQNNYSHFSDTEAVYSEDFDSDAPLYVPNTSSPVNKNYINDGKNWVAYWNDGEWKSYAAPEDTYVRNVTSGNYGTICLPYNATVTGANVYKVVSKVMDGENVRGINLEQVDNLVAGHAYIFQATSTTLTATFTTSNFTSSSDVDGMLGNLGVSAITVPNDGSKYVVKGNKAKKVVSGGDGVTIGQYKAYITLTGIKEEGAGARGTFFFGAEDNETTAIENLTPALNEDVVYDLQGRKVAQPTKGLYIVNGKKVIK